MTEDNRTQNIKVEMERATEALAAANLLADNGYINDAISRLYYFVLYNVRALLLSKDFEPRSHEAAIRLFGLHFIKNNLIDKSNGLIFSKLMKYREEADYNPISMFSSEDFITFKKEAESLSLSIKNYLKKFNLY